MNDLSRFISKRGENLLVEILDFLVQVMRHKSANQMDAYHLGEAMGKVTLGPADCDPIIAEKSGHFLTRMIIEHSKTIHGEKQLLFRVDSGFAWPTICHKPMSKSEAAKSKAKSYNRIIKKIRLRNFDWLEITNIALYALLEDDYEIIIPPFQEPYISIFSTYLDPDDAILSPILFRLVTAASKPIEVVPKDPFENSYLFKKQNPIENQIRVAFDDFKPLLENVHYQDTFINEKTNSPTSHSNKSHLKLINNSLSNMKLNLRKHKSQPNCEIIQEDNDDSLNDADSHMLYSSEYSSNSSNNSSNNNKSSKHHVKNMMKRVIKIGTIVPSKKNTIY